MNAWIARLIGGAVGTVGALAVGMGVAQADVNLDPGVKVDAQVVVGGNTATTIKQPVEVAAKVTGGTTTAKRVVRVTAPVVNVKAAVKPRVRARAEARTPRVAVSTRPRARAQVRAKADVQITRNTNRAQRAEVRVTSSRPAKARVSVAEVSRAKARSERPVKAQADLDAEVAGIPASVCVRIDAGDCSADGSTGGGSAGGTGNTNAGLVGVEDPAVAADATATVGNLVDGAVCVRVNAGDCGTTAGRGGTGGIDAARRSFVPSALLIADALLVDTPVSACVQVNVDGCDADGAAGGNATSSNPLLPTVAGDATATVTDVVDGAVCIRINGGTCGATDGGTDPGTGGGIAPGSGGGDGSGAGGGSDGDDNASDDRSSGGTAVTGRGGSSGGNGALVTAVGLLEGGTPAGLTGLGDRSSGHDELARTGASPVLLPMLAGGLLSLLLSGLLLRRRP